MKDQWFDKNHLLSSLARRSPSCLAKNTSQKAANITSYPGSFKWMHVASIYLAGLFTPQAGLPIEAPSTPSAAYKVPSIFTA